MTLSAYPFDGGAGVNEAEWHVMARQWAADGVVAGLDNELAVYADGVDMQIKVPTGGAHVGGHFARNTAVEARTVSQSHASLPRRDRVVLRIDRSANTVDFVIKAGTAASSPVPPAVTRTDTVWELSLAVVKVAASVGVITNLDVLGWRSFAGARLLHYESLDALLEHPNPDYGTLATLVDPSGEIYLYENGWKYAGGVAPEPVYVPLAYPGWAVPTGGAVLRATRSVQGLVTLTGTASNTSAYTGGEGAVIATLPENYRPEATIVASGTAGLVAVEYDVRPDGKIIAIRTAGQVKTGQWHGGLSGLSFMASGRHRG